MADYSSLYQQAGQQNNVDPQLIAAIAQTESSNNPNAVGPQTDYGQAQGLMQFIPSTAQAVGVQNAFDPQQAVFGGAKLLRQNLDRYGNVEDAVRAYHGGTDPANWGPKTQAYLQAVTKNYQPANPPPDSSQVADSGQIQSDAPSMPSGVVTDPDMIKQLEASSQPTPAQNPNVVTDPGMIAQLEGASKANKNPDELATGIDQFVQGGTFGLGGKAEAALAGAVLSGINGKPFSENYQGALALKNQELKNELQQNPITAIGSGLVGGLATGGILADTSAGANAINYLRSGSAPIQALKGVIGGAGTGAVYGAGSSDYGDEGKGALTGAVVGGALPVAGAAPGAVKDALIPTVAPGVKAVAQIAQDHGIPLNLDQIGGTKLRQYVASATGRLPFSGGDALAEEQQQAFTNAVKNAAGIDTTIPNLNEGYSKALDTVGSKFDAATAGTTVKFDPANLAQISQDAQDALEPGALGVVNRNVDKVFNSLDNDGNISGEQLNSIRSSLSKSMKTPSTASPYLQDLMHEILDAGASSDPDKAALLNEARSQYKNLMTIEPLVAKSTTDQINPAALQQAVIAGYGRRSVARGNAGDLGDLAKVGALMTPKTGNSGTAERAGAVGGMTAIAEAALHPEHAPVILGSLAGLGVGGKGYQLYNSNQALVNAALNKTGGGINLLNMLPTSPISNQITQQVIK